MYKYIHLYQFEFKPRGNYVCPKLHLKIIFWSVRLEFCHPRRLPHLPQGWYAAAAALLCTGYHMKRVQNSTLHWLRVTVWNTERKHESFVCNYSNGIFIWYYIICNWLTTQISRFPTDVQLYRISFEYILVHNNRLDI